MTQLNLITDDTLTQVFGATATAPGGRAWELDCARKRVAYLEAIVEHNTRELAQEKARLAFLEAAQ